MLLTRSRLCPRASPGSSLHLHVLSTPPAFVLSQDQTLREELHKECHSLLEDPPVHMRWAERMTGYCSVLLALLCTATRRRWSRMRIPCTGPCSGRAGRHLETWTQSIGKEPKDVHAVEFSKTDAPCELRGFLSALRFSAAGEELSSPSASYLPPETCSGGRCSLAHPRWESMSLAAPERNSLPDGAEE